MEKNGEPKLKIGNSPKAGMHRNDLAVFCLEMFVIVQGEQKFSAILAPKEVLCLPKLGCLKFSLFSDGKLTPQFLCFVLGISHLKSRRKSQSKTEIDLKTALRKKRITCSAVTVNVFFVALTTRTIFAPGVPDWCLERILSQTCAWTLYEMSNT